MAGKHPGADWSRPAIRAALREAGWSLSSFSLHLGYRRNAASQALRAPWPKMERLIAEAIGLEPHLIWPSRYGPDGRSNRPLFGRTQHSPILDNTISYSSIATQARGDGAWRKPTLGARSRAGAGQSRTFVHPPRPKAGR